MQIDEKKKRIEEALEHPYDPAWRHSREKFLRWHEAASEEQKKAFACLADAMMDVMDDSMKDCVMAISFCKQADLLGHRPVTHVHNFKDFIGLADFYEHCAQRIREKERTKQRKQPMTPDEKKKRIEEALAVTSVIAGRRRDDVRPSYKQATFAKVYLHHLEALNDAARDLLRLLEEMPSELYAGPGSPISNQFHADGHNALRQRVIEILMGDDNGSR